MNEQEFSEMKFLMKQGNTAAAIPLTVRVICFLVITASVVSSKDSFEIPPPLPRDDRHIEKPEFVSYNVLQTGLDRLATETHVRFFDVSRHLKDFSGNSKEAMNVDAFDEVPNSTWYTNRNAANPMSLKDIARGPHTGTGPETEGNWIVTKAKVTGMAPGFFITDSRGDRYIIKFDVVGSPELATGAEVVSTKILYAAGYHVPENFVSVFDPNKVKMGDKVKFKDNRGRKRFMTKADLDTIFKMVEHMPDGRIRGHASKFVDGIPVGSFRFKGTRPDDPNDFIPHEHRREIRGLRVIGSWIQHYDTNLGNTFDSYVTDNGRSYVRHYLIDFGGTFGSSIYGAMPKEYGNIHNVDLPRTLAMVFTLGLYVPQWERWDTIPHPSVGAWESKTFRPNRFRFINPCEAFVNMTDRDGYWGAKIVMSFTDEQIDALVQEGQYSNADAEKYIAQVLKERRDKIGRYYYSKVNSLDNFTLINLESGGCELNFDDMFVKGNLSGKGSITYKYLFSTGEEKLQWKSADKTKDNAITISKDKIPDKLNDFFIVHIKSKHDEKKWSREMRVYLQKSEDNGRLELAGVRR